MGAGGRCDIASLMNGRVTTANPTAKSPIVRIDTVQKPFGAAGALRGGDPCSGREVDSGPGVAVRIVGPGAREESMRSRCVEGLPFADPDSAFQTPVLPGSEPPKGDLTSGRIVGDGAPASPARSRTDRLGRFSSKPTRRDGQASLSARIPSANLEGRP